MQTASSWLARLGLDRQELRAWAMYDWANSAFMTTIIAAVFPVYYAQVAASGIDPNVATFRFSIATTIALTIVALSAPVLGIMADFAAMKKRLLFIFQAIGLVATAAMYFIYEGQWLWALLLFVVGNIGVSGAFTFYDSLLPHIAQPGELDRVSSAGYALGYTGGGLLLALNLAWISSPQTFGLADAGQATRLSFLSVAVWWLVFTLPVVLFVRERPGATPLPMRAAVSAGWRELRHTFAHVRENRAMLGFLLVAGSAQAGNPRTYQQTCPATMAAGAICNIWSCSANTEEKASPMHWSKAAFPPLKAMASENSTSTYSTRTKRASPTGKARAGNSGQT